MKHMAGMIWAVYRKDLRHFAAICVVLMGVGIIYTVMHYLMVWGVIFRNQTIFKTLLQDSYVINAMVFIFPTLLAFKLYENRRSTSRYLEQSLPVSPGMSMLSAYFAVFFYVVIYTIIINFVMAALFNYDTYKYRFGNSFSMDITTAQGTLTISLWKIFKQDVIHLFRNSRTLNGIALYSGIVCLCAGIIRPSVRKKRIGYWTVFCGVLLFLFGVLALFNRFEIGWYFVLGRHTMMLLGTALAAAGAYLYHRYAEV